MTANPVPEPPKEARYESGFEQVALVKFVRGLVRFAKTRRALLSGEPLYNVPTAELRSAGFLGPWSFNATQSMICSVPGMVVAAFSALIGRTSALPATNSVADTVSKVYQVLQPLSVPFGMMLDTYVVGASVLPLGHRHHQNRVAAQRKLLYMDGARGFWPQLLASLSYAVFRSDLGNKELFLDSAIIALFFAVLWQLWVGYLICVEDLTAFDYLSSGGLSSEDDTTWKGLVVWLFIAPILVLGVNLICAVLAYGAAVLLRWVA